MATNYWLGGTVGATTSWETVTNWSLGTLPETGTDDVIFDGRGSGGTIYNCYPGTDNKTITSLTTFPTFTRDIGRVVDRVSYRPLQIDNCTTVYLSGSGDTYLMCGGSSDYEAEGFGNDSFVTDALLNSSGIVYLMSQSNNDETISIWTNIDIISGTLNIIGDSEKWEFLGVPDGNPPVQAGTAIGTLTISTSSAVNVGDRCSQGSADSDFNNPSDFFAGNPSIVNPMDIVMIRGTLNCHSELNSITQYGGTINYGTSTYDFIAGNDDISTLDLYSGTFKWQPQLDDGSGNRILTNSPSIGVINIFNNGSLNCTGITATIDTNPLIETIKQYDGTFNLRNIFANFDVNAFYSFGGTYSTSDGQILTLVN